MEEPHSPPPPLPLREWQDRVDAWIGQFKEGYFPPFVNFARLVEEVGELSRALSHHLGAKRPKPGEALGSVEEELADILFVLTCLSNQLGVDLTAAAHKTLNKIERRDRSRWTLKVPDPTSDAPPDATSDPHNTHPARAPSDEGSGGAR
jgi:NTP pyrophosphatase (non-canonical NTP hydrolase)